MHEPKRIINLMNTPVYIEICAYFREYFEGAPDKQSLKLTEAQLISDLEARFGRKYDAKAIAALLHNGFELTNEPGTYLFMRTDFITAPLRVIEGVTV